MRVVTNQIHYPSRSSIQLDASESGDIDACQKKRANAATLGKTRSMFDAKTDIETV